MSVSKIARFVVALMSASALSSPVQAADEELAVVVNVANPATPSHDEIEKIFLCTIKEWPDGTSAIPFNYPADEPMRRLFDKVVLRLSPHEMGRFWIDQRVREGLRPPRAAADPSLVARLVANLKGAIAYVPASMVTPAMKVVARVRGGKLTSP